MEDERIPEGLPVGRKRLQMEDERIPEGLPVGRKE